MFVYKLINYTKYQTGTLSKFYNLKPFLKDVTIVIAVLNTNLSISLGLCCCIKANTQKEWH